VSLKGVDNQNVIEYNYLVIWNTPVVILK